MAADDARYTKTSGQRKRSTNSRNREESVRGKPCSRGTRVSFSSQVEKTGTRLLESMYYETMESPTASESGTNN